MKRHNSKAYPLLVGKLQRNNTISVWCPFCKRHHNHGWDIDLSKSDVTHRVAHCDIKGSSPFKGGGYYIGIEPKF